jgi:lipid-binding SYLF domain-containing protein
VSPLAMVALRMVERIKSTMFSAPSSTIKEFENVSSTCIQDGAYAFMLNPQSLMAGVSVEGTKISHIVP